MSKKSKRSERDERHQLTRRSLIKWSLAAGAALSVPKWKIFEVLESSGGAALAAEAACQPTNRSVHLVGGTGGFAWFQLLWPHNEVAAAGNNNFAFHAPGQQTLAQGTDRPLTFAPETPFKNLPGRRQMSCFMAGRTETHTNTPVTAATLMGQSIFAVASALQQTNPSVIPVIGVGDVPYGTAPGAARITRVPSAADIVGLFNSAASREGGLLVNTADAELYAAHYKALIGLNRAATRPTQLASYATSQRAAELLGTNLAAALAPTDADRAAYGVNGGTRSNVRDIAEVLMVTAKAFKLGLTSSVILPAMLDDPHGAFNDMANLRATVRDLGAALDGFMAELTATPDDGCAGKNLADNLVMTIHGDTPKDPRDRNGWPDGTPNNANWIYVLGGGYLKTGWFGGVKADGNVRGFDPATGNENGASPDTLSDAATAAVAYAIAKGDPRRVGDFARGIDIAGITQLVQL